MAKPSENTSRDETAALAGPVAMRRKTSRIDWLVAHEEAEGRNFLPAKP